MADSTRQERQETEIQAVLGESISTTVTELSRADGKAGILLGWAGAAVALVTTAATSRRFSAGPAALVWTSDVLLAAAVVLLLATVRPNLRTRTGWMRYATLEPAAILREAYIDGAPEATARRVRDLARIAYGKYVRLRLAVDLVYVAGAFLMAGLLLAA